MKIKEIILSKTYKKGLPEYSNVTVSAGVTIEVGEDEKPDTAPLWASINRQIKQQLDLHQ